jgi:hypothetical protein
VPTLKPGDIVIMDNLRVHKAAGVREAIEAAGAKEPRRNANWVGFFSVKRFRLGHALATIRR